jgi:cytochrome P450
VSITRPGADRRGACHHAPVTYDFADPALATDPFPTFGRLREHDPVYDTGFGYWYVSRYDDCHAVLRDPRLGPGTGVPDSFGLTEGPMYDVMTSWLMALGGAEHARVRRLVSRSFTPRAVEALRPAVEQLADELVGALVAGGGGEIVAELAFPLPMQVVRMLFGIDAGEWDREVVALFDPARADPAGGFLTPMLALVGYFGRVVEERRGAPGDDVFSLLVQPDDDGDTLTDLELVANAVLFVTAGFETTMGLITQAVLALVDHPDQLALLRARPELVANAVDEVLRWEPPAVSSTRSAPVDVEIAGVVVPAGANILVSILAGNRDPRRYDDPDRFDVTRDDIRPLTFGGGAHVCIGAALARMEAEVVLRALLERTSELTRVNDPVEWQTENPTIRRPRALVVATRPRS